MEQIPKHPIVEIKETSLDGVFHERLQAITKTNISVENINSYSDHVLTRLIDLAADVTAAYSKEAGLSEDLSGEALENAAFAHYHLATIGDALNQAQLIAQNINQINSFIKLSTESVDSYYVPPDSRPISTGEKGEFVHPDIIPRLKTLLFLLETDCDIPNEDVHLFRGEINTRWFRQEPYYKIEIPTLERIIYLCEEEGNASYVFDSGLLDQIGIDTLLLDHASKEDLNTVIAELPGIGIRVIQQAGWREVMVELLRAPLPPLASEPLSSEQIGEVLEASSDDLDSWKGFGTDNEGKHWGAVTRISKRLGTNKQTTSNIATDEKLPTKRVKAFNRELDGFCFEDIAELPSIKLLQVPSTANTGEWKDFWIDEEGKHWGSLTSIATTLGFGASSTLGTLLEGHILVTKKLKSGTHVGDAYCLEEVSAIKEVAERLLITNQVSREGEWKDFWTDPNNLHWGTINALVEVIGVSYDTILSEVTELGLPSMQIRDSYNHPTTAFCYESVLNLPHIQELLTLPAVAKEGVWKGFWEESDIKHWGSLRAISEKSEAPLRAITDLAVAMEEKAVRDQLGRSSTAYCYEDMINQPRIQKFLSHDIVQPLPDEGLYIDANGQKIGTIPQLANKFGTTSLIMRNVLMDAEKIVAKPPVGRAMDFYSYTALATDSNFQKKLEISRNSKEVSASGEWTYFYTDQSNSHFGTINAIANKLGRDRGVLERLVSNSPIQSINVLSTIGVVGTGYCIEEIQALLDARDQQK